MYCKKLKDIVNSEDGIKNNIDMSFIQKFDKCIKQETTERERLKLNPIKISNEINVSQKTVMTFFTIGKEMKLFRPRLFYACSCGNHFEIHNLKNIECENHCEIDKENIRSRIYVYYELVEEVEECDFGDYGEYQLDFISEEDLGNFNGTLDEYDRLIGTEKANKLLNNETIQSLKEIKIAHISDLHFGTEHNNGIDNKAKLSGIDDITSNLFDSFKEVANNEKINYLIISGDLTTRNEVEGFQDFQNNISGINIDNNKIYIVPGNHECNRNESVDLTQFAYFIAYTGKFRTPFTEKTYIIDKENQVLIYGFNSVNFKNQESKELFYIKDDEFKNLESTFKELKKKVENFEKYDKIAVVHNNLIPHPNIEIKEYAEMLNLYAIKYKLAKLGFSIVCSGHKHEEVVEKHTIYDEDGKTKDIILISAPSLCGNVSNTRNGFQLINLNKDTSNNLVSIEIQKYESNHLREFSPRNTVEIILDKKN